jgi:hypothetical protein
VKEDVEILVGKSHCPKCEESYVSVPGWLEDLAPDERAATCELTNRMNDFMQELDDTKRDIGKTPEYSDELYRLEWEAIRAGKEYKPEAEKKDTEQ